VATTVTEFNNDATADYYEYVIPAGVAFNDALTLMAGVRIMASADNTFISILELKRAAPNTGVVGAALGRRNNDDIYFSNTNGIVSGGQLIDSQNWNVAAVARSAGAATNAHRSPMAGGAIDSVTLGALADGLTLASGTLRIGGNEDLGHIRMVFAALFTTEITGSQVTGVRDAAATSAVAALSPFFLADASNDFATNLINPGTMDRSASVGSPSQVSDSDITWATGLGGEQHEAASLNLGAGDATSLGLRVMPSGLIVPGAGDAVSGAQRIAIATYTP
jgi:hypothetical protein